VRLKYKIIIGDSREMPEIDDSSVDLVVTSPPYFGVTTYSNGHPNDLSQIRDDKHRFFAELGKVWKEVYRVLKPGKHAVVNFGDLVCGSRVYGYVRMEIVVGDMVKSMEDAGFVPIGYWIWHKYKAGAAMGKAKYSMYENLKHSDPRPLQNWEHCIAFKSRKWAPGVDNHRKLDFTREQWVEYGQGVWYIPADSRNWMPFEDVTESAVFPVELPRRFIKIYSNIGDVILDPFLGSGTTMLAAKILSRSCIGIELQKKFLPVIKRKVGYGSQSLLDTIEWEVIERGN